MDWFPKPNVSHIFLSCLYFCIRERGMRNSETNNGKTTSVKLRFILVGVFSYLQYYRYGTLVVAWSYKTNPLTRMGPSLLRPSRTSHRRDCTSSVRIIGRTLFEGKGEKETTSTILPKMYHRIGRTLEGKGKKRRRRRFSIA